jgi:HEXXH motif-containing protein
LSVVQEAWPEGDQLLTTLTSRIIPLRAKGVVSFSYRHQPGLSFINCFDRDDLDLIDDLIHENGHHHLNLLLRKYVLYRDDRNQEIFYSPWRRSLRPLRGILHATFTFTMGALLFERLSTWGSGPAGYRAWTQSGLSRENLRRTRFRCIEEMESVRYALQDLQRADRQFGWIPQAGKDLIGHLSRILSAVTRRIDRYVPSVRRSRYGPVLRRHRQELHEARRRYGSWRL